MRVSSSTLRTEIMSIRCQKSAQPPCLCYWL
jgi:hypothetical protein